jgi:hypothetical protein
MIKCDLCGTEIDSKYQGFELRGYAQPSDVNEVCGKCYNDLEHARRKIEKVIENVTNNLKYGMFARAIRILRDRKKKPDKAS